MKQLLPRELTCISCPIGCRIEVTKTDKPMPKEMMSETMELINSLNIEVPIKVGDIIIERLLGTDVNIVASRSLIE
ncbi:MAG: DUF1667 domain-containing protein [Clostridiales bacterium]|nr:DUF1667 domain-containing protein [Clostridiales bacterium]